MIRAGTAAALGTLLLASSVSADRPPGEGWPFVGGDPGNTRFSPLKQINRGNVAQLEVAWTYRHGDVHDPRGSDSARSGTAFQATPILVEGRLIFPTPYSRVIALDPATGEELWIFDPKLDRTKNYGHGFVNRGVAYWRDPQKKQGPCAGRVFVATTDARLIAIDAETGKPCRKFGRGGTVDLHVGVDIPLDSDHYKFTSNPVVVGDVVVVGPSLSDKVDPQPTGSPRAFDVRTGKLRWSFNMVPRQGEFGTETWENESWRFGYGINPWAPMSADPERDLLFVPGSAPSPHFYGGQRPGDNLFGNSVLALRGDDGKRLWHFQAVRSDIWDYDLASPPMLVTLQRDGEAVDAVILPTKMGLVFTLDRDTGEPVFPIENRPAPDSDIPGEQPAETQPFPLKPPPLVPTTITDDDLWHDGPTDIAECREMLEAANHEGLYTPIRKDGGILYPSNAGGANWSGGAFDPGSQVLYVPVNNMAMFVRLKPQQVKLPGAEQPKELWVHADVRVWSDSNGTPCLAPPWGLLVAVDMQSGEILWRVPAGGNPRGPPGLPNMGPVLATAGGVVFHGGTAEPAFYAHDTQTGEILARFEVPAGVHGGPMTYRLKENGRQYLVVAPGGHHRLALQETSPLSDWIIAYTLPD